VLSVDTGVWSLTLRPGAVAAQPEVLYLEQALLGSQTALPPVQPDRQDRVDAAWLRATCRRDGMQVETSDALLAQVCIRHHRTLLVTDNDFVLAARHGR